MWIYGDMFRSCFRLFVKTFANKKLIEISLFAFRESIVAELTRLSSQTFAFILFPFIYFILIIESVRGGMDEGGGEGWKPKFPSYLEKHAPVPRVSALNENGTRRRYGVEGYVSVDATLAPRMC